MKTQKSKGFTLVEMMVSVSIAMIIMAVILFRYQDFNDDLALSSAQQEISLAIRQAQVYGLSVKEVSSGGGNFTSHYGIYVDTSDPKSYYIFSDLNGDNMYNDGTTCPSGGECVEKSTLRNGVSITSVCGAAFGGSMACSSPGPTPNIAVDSMSVMFVRPNPDAFVYFFNGGSMYGSGNFQTGRIVLTSTQGKSVTLSVQNTGQISVQ